MLIIRLILALALPLLLGYCLIAIICQNKLKLMFLERAGLSWILGLGILGIEMFIISILGWPLDLKTVSIPIAILIIMLAPYIIFKRFCFFDMAALKSLFFALIETRPKDRLWLFLAERLL